MKITGKGRVMARINIRIDDKVKHEAESVLTDIGISMSTAINVYLKTIAKERRIPIELYSDPFHSESNLNRLTQIVNNLESGASTLKEHDLIEVEDD